MWEWAKSTVTAVHRVACENESLVLVLSPSERQSSGFVRADDPRVLGGVADADRRGSSGGVTPMLAVGGGDLWLLSTPYGKRRFFWKTRSKGGRRSG
jgi:hypothetical protein